MVLPSKFFITGTDTDVGKTLVAAVLVVGLGYEYFKPVQSGIDEGSDTDWVKGHTGLPDDYFHRETYRLHRPLSPHEAARIDGVEIDLDEFRLPEPNGARGLIVEGAGGVMVPLNERSLMVDLMKKLDLPVLLVARSGLGTINHTLLSVAQMRRRDIPVLGVVMNGAKNPGNRQAIEHFGNVPVLGRIEPLDRIDPDRLLEAYQRSFLPVDR